MKLVRDSARFNAIVTPLHVRRYMMTSGQAHAELAAELHRGSILRMQPSRGQADDVGGVRQQHQEPLALLMPTRS